MESWRQAWQKLQPDLELHASRLVGEIEAAWRDLEELVKAVQDQYTRLQSQKVDLSSQDSVLAGFAAPSRDLCLTPIQRYLDRHPALRALRAMQDYQSGLERHTHVLPESVASSGVALAGEMGVARRGASLDSLYVWQRAQHTVPARRVVTDFLLENTLLRAPLDGLLHKLINETCLHLRMPWQMFVSRVLGADPREDWADWLLAVEKARAAFETLHSRYGAWKQQLTSNLASTVAREGRYTDAGRSWNLEQQSKNIEFWARQQRCVTSVIELEAQWLATVRAISGAARIQREGVLREHAELEAAAAELLDRLPSASPEQDCALPSIGIPVLDIEERLKQWREAVRAAVAQHLPEQIETCAPAALPAWWRRWRRTRPRVIVEQSAGYAGIPEMRAALEPWTAQNQGRLQDIVRSVDAVEYARESLRNDPSAPTELFQEAVANASHLLESRPQAHASAAAMDSAVVSALLTMMADAAVKFEFEWSSVSTRASRRRKLRYVSTARQMVKRSATTTSTRAREQFRKVDQAVFEYLGLRMPERPPVQPVRMRPQLSDVLPVRLDRSLPAIYRHLFALAPVQDQRFLVGRQAQIEGLQVALERWQGGMDSAALLVGGRGSGKTSLLNCAVSLFPEGVEVVRAEFSQRVRTKGQMDDFLGSLLDNGTGARRVIIIEEFERSYLKVVGGLEGLRRLGQIITRTARDVFWILSVNDSAMRFLNFAAEVGSHFPLRIDAMAVTKDQLRNAILQRHNLSGLRLRFEPPAERSSRAESLRRWFGLDEDPEQLFFDSLYYESGGVFRSAFELWLASIKRVDGVYVEMRQPLASDYTRLWSVLKQADHFTLAAIEQHGSLLPEELSEVLLEPVDRSTVRLRRLEAMELLEHDPRFPGMRIAPRASRFARETLHRVNLL